MPSMNHEVVVQLFRNRPELASELLRVLEVRLPAYTQTRIESAEFADVEPATYRADAVVLLYGKKPAGKRDKKPARKPDKKPKIRPVLGIIVEVQRSPRNRKQFTWPAYVTQLRARFECPACVLVVTETERVAKSCRKPIKVGPGSVVTPLVVSPATVPVISDEAAARRAPELAVLSCMVHAANLDPEAAARSAYAAMRAVSEELPDDRAILYHDVISTALPAAARIALEQLMDIADYEFKSEFARKYLATGEARAVVKVLESRGLPLSEEARGRILSCTDSRQIDVWIRKATSVASVEELFSTDDQAPAPGHS